MQNLSYLLFELGCLSSAFLILFTTGHLRTVFTRRFVLVSVLLYLFWTAWDHLAIRLGVFVFPGEGNLPPRALRAPLEEHLFFFVHTTCVWTALVVLRGEQPGAQQAR